MPGAVLVPVDGSNFSEHAIPCGLALARGAGVTLHLVLVHVPFQPVTPRSPIADLVLSRSIEQKDLDVAYMRVLTDRLDSADVPVQPVVLHGHVTEALAGYVREQGIGLVVMTTHGRGGLQRAWLGSTADSLVRHCSAPLLLIRPGEEHVDTICPSDHQPFRRLLVALDGSETAEQALRAACRLGVTRGSRIVLAHVLQPPLVGAAPYLPHTIQVGRDETAGRGSYMRDYLGRVAGAEWLAGHDVETRIVVDYEPARAILDLARTTDADLVVLGTHGRGGLRRMLMGSVADKVIRATQRCVLVHRGGPAATNGPSRSDATRSGRVEAGIGRAGPGG